MGAPDPTGLARQNLRLGWRTITGIGCRYHWNAHNALQKIIQQMHEFQISPADIQAAHSAKPSRAKRKKAVERTKPRRTVAPKYRHPESGDTWTGRGRAPRWLTSAENAGATREQFRI